MKLKVKDLYYVLLYLAFIPSGSICGVPIKDIIIIFLFGYIISKRKITLVKSTRVMCYSLLLMVPWGIISIQNGYSDGMVSFFKCFLSFFLMMIVTYIYIDNGWMDFYRALNCLKSAAFILMGIKIIVEIFLIFHLINYSAVFFVFEKIFDTVWMPMEGLFSIYRITTPNDVLPLIVIGLLIITENKDSLIKRYLMILLGFFFVMITFSRVLIVEYIVIIISSFVVFIFDNHSKKDYISFLFLSIFLIAVGGYIYSNERIMELLYLRFSSDVTVGSDSVRKIQYQYLMNGVLEHPIIGNGLGAYVKSYIRSFLNIHSYELEWLALFYQLGIAGVILIIGNIVYSLYLRIFKNISNRGIKIYLGILFVIWLIKPIYNPNMFSSHSAIELGLMIFISYVYGNKKTVN